LRDKPDMDTNKISNLHFISFILCILSWLYALGKPQ